MKKRIKSNASKILKINFTEVEVHANVAAEFCLKLSRGP